MGEITVSATADIVKAELDQQITTAKAFPRDIAACADELKQMVCMDLDTAQSCLYSMPRDGKAITGPSVRLAEMAVACWGNIKAGWRVLAIEERFVECEGICHDLQKNVVSLASAKRSIWGRRGRYSENMIQTTIMACGAVAYRNAVFKTVPAALVKGAIDASHAKVIAEVGDYKERIPGMLKKMAENGVEELRLLRFFGLESIDELSAQQFLDCLGIFNSIANGESVAGDYFGKPKREASAGTSLDDLKASGNQESGE